LTSKWGAAVIGASNIERCRAAWRRRALVRDALEKGNATGAGGHFARFRRRRLCDSVRPDPSQPINQ
jgi:hypothetical protein